MASFQIHDDQENHLANAGRSKINLQRNNDKVLQKRTVLGDINSNSGRINTRQSKQEAKAAEKPLLKNKHDFVIHEDVLEPKSKPVQKPVGHPFQKVKGNIAPKVESKVLTRSKSKEEKDEKLDLCKAVISVPRQPLKDLKISDNVDEEECDIEVMSESSSSPSVVSPMSVKVSTPPTSPLVRHTKPALQLLYDMEEYRKEIFQYLLQSENRGRAKTKYMARQPEVTYSMRSILVDWLVEVAEEYKLHTETLYLAVSFIDRFLSVMSVVKGKLQLLGTAAMFVASKYEEIYPPDVSEFVYITDDTYTKRQVLRMEQLILKVLNFDISVPTIFMFLQHIAVDCNLSIRLCAMAQYLCELTLLVGDPYLAYTPSMVACAALAKARYCLEYDDVWSEELQKTSGYSLAQLAPCIQHLNETHVAAASHPQQAVQDKYKSHKWQRVAEVKPLALHV